MGLDIGEKGGLFMKKKTEYTNERIGNIKIIKDFFPSPEALVFKEESVKVTMTLSKSSVTFFKKEAKKYHGHYQSMIRNLLDLYTHQHLLP